MITFTSKYLFAVSATVLLIIGLLLPHLIYSGLAMQILCFALFAVAFNLAFGYGGMLSFGHAAFFGGSAYAVGIAAKLFALPPLLSLLFGVLVACVLGFLIGALAIRRSGIYFAMITLALSQVIYFIVTQVPFLGGEDGLQAIPRGDLFGVIDLSDSLSMYYFTFAIVLLGILLVYRIIHSPFGEIMAATRENPDRVLSLGYDIGQLKLLIFVMSASLAGLAGGLKALIFQVVDQTDVHWVMSGDVVLMTLLGGIGTFFGPIVGSTVVVSIDDWFGEVAGTWSYVLTGTFFICCVLMFRRGIVGELIEYFRRQIARRARLETHRA